MPGRDLVVKTTRRVHDDGPTPVQRAYVTDLELDLVGRVIKRHVVGLDGQQAAHTHRYAFDGLGNLAFYQDPDQYADPDQANRYARTVFDADGRWVRFIKSASATDKIELISEYVDTPANWPQPDDHAQGRPRPADGVDLRRRLPPVGAATPGLHRGLGAPDHGGLRCRLATDDDHRRQRQRDSAGVGPAGEALRADGDHRGRGRVAAGDAGDGRVRPARAAGEGVDRPGVGPQLLHGRRRLRLGRPGPQAEGVVHLHGDRHQLAGGDRVGLHAFPESGGRRHGLPAGLEVPVERLRDRQRAGRDRAAGQADAEASRARPTRSTSRPTPGAVARRWSGSRR